MAALSTLEEWLLIYLGTTSTDPAYPQTARRMLINRAYLEIVGDIHDANPNYFVSTTTLSPAVAGTRSYNLPADFAKAIEVRIDTSEGTALTEVRQEELFAAGDFMLAYSITGPDQAAVLEVSTGVELDSDIYVRYAYWPAELATDGATPILPTAFHDVISLKAAEVAYQLGGEQDFPQRLKVQLDDRLGQLWYKVGQRSTDPRTVRG